MVLADERPVKRQIGAMKATERGAIRRDQTLPLAPPSPSGGTVGWTGSEGRSGGFSSRTPSTTTLSCASLGAVARAAWLRGTRRRRDSPRSVLEVRRSANVPDRAFRHLRAQIGAILDRKSTRLNSSHLG